MQLRLRGGERIGEITKRVYIQPLECRCGTQEIAHGREEFDGCVDVEEACEEGGVDEGLVECGGGVYED